MQIAYQIPNPSDLCPSTTNNLDSGASLPNRYGTRITENGGIADGSKGGPKHLPHGIRLDHLLVYADQRLFIFFEEVFERDHRRVVGSVLPRPLVSDHLLGQHLQLVETLAPMLVCNRQQGF